MHHHHIAEIGPRTAVRPVGGIGLAPTPERPPAAGYESAIELTGKGLAYVHGHTRAARHEIETAIETHLALVQTLIAFLDDADGDPDLEAAGDELDASYPEGKCRACQVDGKDTLQHEDWEPDGSDEPNLGAPEPGLHQAGFYMGVVSGAPLVTHVVPVGSQTHWAKGWRDDDEAVNEDGADESDCDLMIEGGNERVAK
jgi:hypothetical protein